jgi:putative (di)nucleoside polyphosphate hydrolase
VIDPDGYRPNVGIVLMRQDGQVFWARRVRRDGWQFPQGGMNTDETPVEAMYRELQEETGLLPEHVEVLGATPGWLRYKLPARAIRRKAAAGLHRPEAVWFLLRPDRRRIPYESWTTPTRPSSTTGAGWTWYPVEHVVMFKRGVYARALRHLAPLAAGGRAGVTAMPKSAAEAWMPGHTAGHDRPRKRPRTRGYWPKKATGDGPAS